MSFIQVIICVSARTLDTLDIENVERNGVRNVTKALLDASNTRAQACADYSPPPLDSRLKHLSTRGKAPHVGFFLTFRVRRRNVRGAAPRQRSAFCASRTRCAARFPLSRTRPSLWHVSGSLRCFCVGAACGLRCPSATERVRQSALGVTQESLASWDWKADEIGLQRTGGMADIVKKLGVRSSVGCSVVQSNPKNSPHLQFEGAVFLKGDAQVSGLLNAMPSGATLAEREGLLMRARCSPLVIDFPAFRRCARRTLRAASCMPSFVWHMST